MLFSLTSFGAFASESYLYAVYFTDKNNCGYSLSQPEKQLVAKAWIFLLPALGWLIFFTHATLLSLFHEVEGNIQKIFSWVTVGMMAVIAILLIRVIMIVT